MSLMMEASSALSFDIPWGAMIAVVAIEPDAINFNQSLENVTLPKRLAYAVIAIETDADVSNVSVCCLDAEFLTRPRGRQKKYGNSAREHHVQLDAVCY